MKHSPTPWRVHEGHTRIWIKSANDENVTDPCIGSLQERADLARIVACVNACEAFSTEALQAGDAVMLAEATEVLKQRDLLVDQLPNYATRVAEYERQGMSTSDAQGVVDAENLRLGIDDDGFSTAVDDSDRSNGPRARRS